MKIFRVNISSYETDNSCATYDYKEVNKMRDIIIMQPTPKEGDYVISPEERDRILSAVSDLTVGSDKLPTEYQEKLRNLTSLLYWILNDQIEQSDEEGDIIDYVFTHRI